MSKYISLEHAIRNALSEGGVGFGTKGGDKAKGTSGAFYNTYSSKSGGHSAAGARVAAKDSGKENIKMEEDAGVPNEGNATPTAKAYGSFDEDGKKKLKKESLNTMGGQGNETGEYGRNLSAEDGGKKKRLKEDGDEDMIKQSRAALNAATDPAEKEKLQQKHDRLLSTVDRIPSNSTQQSFEDGGKKKKNIKEGIVDSALKMGGRLGAKIVPGLGQGLSAVDAASRYASGDTTGAAISAAGAIPYIGSVAGPVGDVVNTIRDVTGMSTPSKSNASADATDMPVTPGQAPQTIAPKTSVGGQTPTKRLKRTVKEETGPDNTRRKNSSKELVGRPNSAGVKSPDSVLARNASVKEKIIAENKKLAKIVKKTKEEQEQESAGPNITTKTKDMGNVVFNPPLKKPDVGSYNN